MSKLEQPVKNLILGKMIGSMYWHGETYADEESFDNQEKAYEVALALIDGIYDNATLASNAVATYSGKKLNKRAIEMLRNIKTICDEVDYDE